MERLGIPYLVAIQEPMEVIRRMVFIWSLDAERDKLEAKRQELKNRSGSSS
jgi:hypothetical protein